MSCDAIWEGLDLAAEHYHPRKLYFLERLQARASSKISDHFLSIREIYDPASDPLPVGAKVYDVTDALGNFLGEGRSVATPDKVGSTKKIAQPGDVIISRLRSYLREIAVIPDEKHPYLLSSEFIVLRRRKKQKGKFLLPYLLSEPVQTILQWSQDGSNHPRFTESLLLTLPLPDEILRHSNELNHLVEQAMSAFKRSKSLYAEAEVLLLAELGLDDLDLSHQPTYTRNFSETWAAGRLDAEFYEPRYYTLLDRIRNSPYGAAPLLSKARYIREYADIDPAKSYRYIELADINQSIGTVEKASEYRGDKLPSRARLLLKSGDVVISSVQGSLDKVALIPEHLDGALGSTGFFQFRPLEYPAEVLLVLLSSKPMQLQFHRHARGAILMATAASSLEDIFVPEVPDSLQEKITELVRKSHSSYDEAKRLLEEAKRRVEEMVLGEE